MEPAVDKSGWYNQYQEFSTPWIPYVPHYNYHAVFTVCELEDSMECASTMVQMAQLSGQAPMVKMDLTGLPDQEYTLVIKTFGMLSNSCSDAGEEFNPLKEVWNGTANPHADQSRGKIDSCITESAGTCSIFQKSLLQNLSGKDSLVGKSLHLMRDDLTLACCVIGLDEVPEHLRKQEPTYRPKAKKRGGSKKRHQGYYGAQQGYGGW